ncbi:MAG: hypothetical protein RLZZ595_1673 [Bacteroidota bacterium]|jgi:hypothetical protein
MTTAQRNDISSPAEGLIVYITDVTPGFYYYDGSGWSSFKGSSFSSISDDGKALYIGNPSGGGGVYTGSNIDGTRLMVNGGRELESIKMAFAGDPYNNELSFNWYSSAWRIRTERSSGDITDLSFWRTTGGEGTLEKMRLKDNGRLGIGTNDPQELLDVAGNVKAQSYISTSDARLKNVLQSWKNDDEIDFVQFRWKNGADNREHYGYLAQDVQKVLPDAVYANSEGMMAVNYEEVHSYKISKQEQRIKELEETVEELKKIIKRKRSRR